MAHIQIAGMTPAERRRSKVRHMILEAAERVFGREGEAGLSIRRLADEIDYSPAAIYKYFESKQDLIDELRESFFARLLAEIDDLDKPARVPGAYRAYATACIMTYMRVALDAPHHYAAAFSGVTSAEVPPISLADDSYKARAFGKLYDVVSDGMTLGVFRADLDALLASKLAWAACHGFVALTAHIPQFAAGFVEGSPPSTEALMAEHADFVMRGLGA